MVFFYLNVPNNAFFKYMLFIINLNALANVLRITVVALGRFLTFVIVRPIEKITGKIMQFVKGDGYTLVESY